MPKLYNHARATELEFINLYKKARAGIGQRGAVGPIGPAGPNGKNGVDSSLKVLRKYFVQETFTKHYDRSMWAACFNWNPGNPFYGRDPIDWDTYKAQCLNRSFICPAYYNFIYDNDYSNNGWNQVPLLVIENPCIIYKTFFHILSLFRSDIATDYDPLIIYATSLEEEGVLDGPRVGNSWLGPKNPIAQSGRLSCVQEPSGLWAVEDWALSYSASDCLWPRKIVDSMLAGLQLPDKKLRVQKNIRWSKIRDIQAGSYPYPDFWHDNIFIDKYDIEYGAGSYLSNWPGDAFSDLSLGHFLFAYGGPYEYPDGVVIYTDSLCDLTSYADYYTDEGQGTAPFYGGCLAFTMFYEEFT